MVKTWSFRLLGKNSNGLGVKKVTAADVIAWLFRIYFLEKTPRTLTLPKTNGSHLKIGHPKRNRSSSNHPFSGANWLLVSGRVYLGYVCFSWWPKRVVIVTPGWDVIFFLLVTWNLERLQGISMKVMSQRMSSEATPSHTVDGRIPAPPGMVLKPCK